jgi:formylglycine-generating enzyme required for sulfatase activity
MGPLFRRRKIASLGALLALPATLWACVPSGDKPLVAVELEAKENTLDGCTACGCRAKGEIAPGAEHQWWISFGLATSDPQGAWEAAAPSSHCGSGSFQKVASDFRRTVGTPYVILDLSTTAVVLATGDVDLETRWTTQKLSGFDESGQPVYARSTQKRVLSFTGKADVALPLLVANEREREGFGVHEVLLRLRTTLLGREPAAAYGIISVSADVPGAEVLLDGGFVGRITEGSPTLLKNVLTGTREIRVRDFSGHEARRQLVVEKDGTAELALEVLDLTSAPARHDLVPVGKNPQGHEEYWRVRDRATVVRIPAGEFLMGSPVGEGESNERPQHRVYASEFLIDKTEVTWRQFRRFADARGAQLPREPVWGTPDDYPVAFILWEEAKAYCEWVGGRLPTEAEWEKAARGTDGRTYAWGNEWDPRRCNSISGGLHRPENVGSYPGCVSPYGVLDMPGSVWEWCADRYREAYYAESPSRNPTGPTSGRLRVMRGGAWMSQPLWLRAAYRFGASPSSRNVDHGFRCAQDPPG